MMNVDKYKKLLLPIFISMSMVACGGGGGSSDAGTTQPPISENQTAVHAMVQSSDGSLLKGVTVSILDQKATTNENGIAQLNAKIPKGMSEVVVKYEAEGFVTQSVLVKTNELANVTGHMLAAKDIVPVHEIEKAQVIKATSLDATITISENAFIQPDGKFAQGKVNVYFTPWNINSNDLNAMPANGFAVDAQGNRTQLISAGMITATFVDAETGERLQLAPGKTADIQMNVPFSSINNTKLLEGTKIPMWHFDESKGLWVEEGEGKVVKSINSPTGLAVKATVSHFSTWNWDFKISNGGYVFVQCQSEAEPIPCKVVAKVSLDDKSVFTQSSYIGEDGITIINMPSSGSIHWVATDYSSGLISETTSGVTGKVIIELGKPKTNNFVKCILPNQTTTSCTGKINNSKEFSISTEGAKIISLLDIKNNELTWEASSPIFYENGEWVIYSGETTSGATGTLSISLDNREVLYKDSEGAKFTLVCTHPENSNSVSSKTMWDRNPIYQGSACKVRITVMHMTDESDQVYDFNGVYGIPFEVKLPSRYPNEVYNSGLIYLDISGEIEMTPDQINAGIRQVGRLQTEGNPFLDRINEVEFFDFVQ